MNENGVLASSKYVRKSEGEVSIAGDKQLGIGIGHGEKIGMVGGGA